MNLKAHPVLPAPSAHRDDGLASLWRSVVGHRRLFVSIVCACFFAGALYALVATPQYRTEALLRIQTKPGPSISALSDVSGAISAGPSANDESEILTSRAIVDAAIQQTHADLDVRNQSYFPLIGRWLASRHANDAALAPPFLGLKSYAWGGETFEPGAFIVPDDALGDTFRLVAGEAGSWTLYDKKGTLLARGAGDATVPFSLGPGRPGWIRVDALRARPGVTFSISKEPPQLAYDAVSKRLKTVVSNTSSTLEQPSMITLSYQADGPRRAKQMIDAIVKAYLQRDVAFRADGAQRNLDSLRARLPGLKADLQKAEDALNRYRTRTGTIDVDQQSAALIGRLSTLADHQMTLQLALDNVKERFRPGSPEYQTMLTQLKQVKSAIHDTTAAADKLPAAQREYVRLSRQVAVATQLYTSVLTNSQQLEIAVASTAPGVNVVDWGIAPYRPSWPRRGIVLLGALLGGLFAALVTIYLISRYRGELHSPLDLAAFSDRPCVAVVAAPAHAVSSDGVSFGTRGAHAANRLLAAHRPQDPCVETLRGLRTSLKATFAKRRRSTAGKVLLFSGPTAGVGCSFVASNIAYLLAQTNADVLLVDADMRVDGTPSSAEVGLANVLDGTASIDGAISRIDNGRLSVMAAGRSTAANPGELLERPAFKPLLGALRARYDFVILDAPAVLPYSDTLSIAAQRCDLILLVLRGGLTRSGELEASLQRFASVGASVDGHVFNTSADMAAPVRLAWREWIRGLLTSHAPRDRRPAPPTAKDAFELTKKALTSLSRR